MEKENNTDTLSEAEINEIHASYVSGVDKWQRIYCGLASSLKKYEDGIIYIRIENTEKVRLSNFETAEKIVESWITFNDKLKQAKGWVVYFYRTNASPGFAFSYNDAKNEDFIEDAVKQMKAEKELKLVNISSGIFVPKQ